MIELGGNITLTGFEDRDYAELIVVKKITGRYARQLSDNFPGFNSLRVSLQSRSLGKYELQGAVSLGGKQLVAECSERNLFVALDLLLKKLLSQLS